MIIKKLDWDTDFFGYETGMVKVDEAKNFDFEWFKINSNLYKLIYIYSDEKLNHDGLNLVDTKVTFHKEGIIYGESGSEHLYFYNKDKDDFGSLEALALSSGILSRFNLDVNFKNNEYENLYKKWIYNEVYNKGSLGVIVYKENKNILGFTSLREIDKQLCDISLVAVDSRFRGRKIGTKLINFTIKQAYNKNYKNIQVVTQLNNKPAINLYLKCGFKLDKTQFVYHYWNL